MIEEIAFGAFAQVHKHREGYPLGGYWYVDVQRDASGNPVLTASGNAIVDYDNQVFLGPQLPTREVAFSNTITLMGNLHVFAQMDYKGGNYQWCAICSIRNRIDRNSWEVNDPDASPAERAVWLSRQTKTHLFPADLIKLREVALSYTLPTQLSNAFRADRVAVTLSGRNLWMWTKYEGTSDPEVTFYSQREFNELDYASTPMTRRLAASIALQF